MRKPRGNMLRKILPALLALALLMMSSALALAPLSASAGTHAALLSYHQYPAAADHSGSPCRHHDGPHGLACCCAGACVTIAAWLPADNNDLALRCEAFVYRELVTPHPDDEDWTPALPPPRHAV
jgi:hypothetical protein